MSPEPSAIDCASKPYDVLTPAQVERLRADADRILDEIGLEVRDHPGALERFAAGGARVEGRRVRFEPGRAKVALARKIAVILRRIWLTGEAFQAWPQPREPAPA